MEKKNNKKKLLLIILTVVMIFALVACSSKTSSCEHAEIDEKGQCVSCKEQVKIPIALIEDGVAQYEIKETDKFSDGEEDTLVKDKINFIRSRLNYYGVKTSSNAKEIELSIKSDLDVEGEYVINTVDGNISIVAKSKEALCNAIDSYYKNILGIDESNPETLYNSTYLFVSTETKFDSIPIIGNFGDIKWQQVVMWVIGAILIYLAIAKDMEPTLLLPMGFGAILVNLPNSAAIGEHGPISVLFKFGIDNGELFPLLLFIGIGAMIDFAPLLSNPKLFLFGAAAQFGIFLTLGLATLAGFDIKDAASIGIIGAADGPTAIYVANVLKSNYLAPIMVAAYSYMALVPVIQPPVIRLITTKKERLIRMDYSAGDVKKTTKILFPIVVTIITGIIAPESAVLIGFLMFGNLIRECGVLNALSETAQKVLANIITLLLGITIAAQMTAEKFVQWQTLLIIALGLFAFIFDTVGGVMFAKLINLFSKKKINPMIGAAGISAFPMSSRVIHKMGLQEDPSR